MKIRGKTIQPPRVKTIAIPREDDEGNPDDVIFQCHAVLDFDEFDALCPRPKPPLVTPVGKTPYADDANPAYLKKVEDYSEKRSNWMILKSLEATEGLEWDSVDMKDPETWANYKKELETLFTPREVDEIVMGVFDANIPNEQRQKEALERFFQPSKETP